MSTIEQLETRIKSLEKKVGMLEDIDAIKRLHRIYSYYVMYMLNKEIVDCFADHPDVGLYWIEGAWLGKKGVRDYFGVDDPNKPDPPAKFTHQVMPIAGAIEVEGDRAKGRWYAFGGVNVPSSEDAKSNGSLVGGTYEIEYIKENGIWKFLTVKWIINFTVALPEGSWGYPEKFQEWIWNMINPEQKIGQVEAFVGVKPDEKPFVEDPRFISGYILPFHFKHPVTGKTTTEGERNARIIKKAIDIRKKEAEKKKAELIRDESYVSSIRIKEEIDKALGKK
jgi:hypothetical protein